LSNLPRVQDDPAEYAIPGVQDDLTNLYLEYRMTPLSTLYLNLEYRITLSE
jgi:hypothetical protein